ncbi:MAG: hypothetical protein AAFW98_11510, partial [Pseudomonadota bacterium]
MPSYLPMDAQALAPTENDAALDRPLAVVPTPHAGLPGALPRDHPGVAFGRVGVLLVNLGTPE